MRAYRESLGVMDTLAAKDPGNTERQRDLIVSHWRLADLLEREAAEREAAKGHWQEALRLARAMQEKGTELPADSHFVATIERRLKALRA